MPIFNMGRLELLKDNIVVCVYKENLWIETQVDSLNLFIYWVEFILLMVDQPEAKAV